MPAGNPAGGSNRQVQFNDNGNLNGDPRFVFDPDNTAIVKMVLEDDGDAFIGIVLSKSGESTFKAQSASGTPTSQAITITSDQQLQLRSNFGTAILNGVDTVVGGNSSKLGFYGNKGTPQPTVTGSRAGNEALANLLTALAAMNLIVDNTTP